MLCGGGVQLDAVCTLAAAGVRAEDGGRRIDAGRTFRASLNEVRFETFGKEFPACVLDKLVLLLFGLLTRAAGTLRIRLRLFQTRTGGQELRVFLRAFESGDELPLAHDLPFLENGFQICHM